MNKKVLIFLLFFVKILMILKDFFVILKKNYIAKVATPPRGHECP